MLIRGKKVLTMSENLVSISRLLSNTLYQRLKRLGFRLKKEGIFYKPYDKGMYLRLGLNEASKGSKSVTINPILGVGYLPLEDLLCELTNKKKQPYLFATFSANIGGFTNQNVALKFTFQRDAMEQDVEKFVDETATIMEGTISVFNSKYDVVEGLEIFPPVQQPVERKALAYYLLANDKQADLLIEKELDRVKTQHVIIRKQFETFVEEFYRYKARKNH